MALFSGIAVEDMFAGLTALPSGWYVEWVVSLANTNSTDWCLVQASSWHHYDISYFHPSAVNNDTLINYVDKTSVLHVLFSEPFCNN